MQTRRRADPRSRDKNDRLLDLLARGLARYHIAEARRCHEGLDPVADQSVYDDVDDDPSGDLR